MTSKRDGLTAHPQRRRFLRSTGGLPSTNKQLTVISEFFNINWRSLDQFVRKRAKGTQQWVTTARTELQLSGHEDAAEKNSTGRQPHLEETGNNEGKLSSETGFWRLPDPLKGYKDSSASSSHDGDSFRTAKIASSQCSFVGMSLVRNVRKIRTHNLPNPKGKKRKNPKKKSSKAAREAGLSSSGSTGLS
eukprot:IDg6521t1